MTNLDEHGWQKISDIPVEKNEKYVLIDELKDLFEMYNIDGDGNCLFRAISYAYSDDEKDYELIKSLLSSYIASNKSDTDTDVKHIVSAFMDTTKGEHELTYEDQKKIYLEQLNTPKYWGNQQECIIIANIMNINIEVYDMTGNIHNYESKTQPPIKTIYLYYCGKIPEFIEKQIFTHFNVLKLKPLPSELVELLRKIFELEQQHKKTLQKLKLDNLYHYIDNTVDGIALLTQYNKNQLKQAAKKLINYGKLKTNIIALRKEITEIILIEFICIYSNQSALTQTQKKNVITRIKQIYDRNRITDSTPAFEELVMKPVVTEYMKIYINNLVDGIDVTLISSNKELLKTRTLKALEIDDKKLKTYNIRDLEKIAIDHVNIETSSYFAGGKNKTAKQDYFKLIGMYK